LFLKKDNFKLGFVLGLIVPIIVFLIIYMIRFPDYSLGEFITMVPRQNALITFFGAWCMVGNIALLTLFLNTNKYQTAKGIFFISVIYGIGILLLKLFN
jgi:hypothetical protein